MNPVKTIKKAVKNILGKRVTRKALKKAKQQAARNDKFAIFVLPFLGMEWERYVTGVPLNVDAVTRIIAGACKNSKRYSEIRLCVWDSKTNEYEALRFQP